jgi:hypothetical protein
MRRAPNAAVLTGLLLAAMGFAIAVVATQFPQGTLRVMGPGFLPRQLGLGLGALGVGIGAVGAVFGAALVLRSSAAPVLAVGAGVLLLAGFAAALPVALVGFRGRWVVAGLAALPLAACMAVLFTGLLRLPMPAWPRWV